MTDAWKPPLRRIAKSKMAKISRKRGNPIVAHLSFVDELLPLCQVSLAKGAVWLVESDRAYAAVRDCQNCLSLARDRGLAVLLPLEPGADEAMPSGPR